MSKLDNQWHKEIRVFDICIGQARQIIAELETSVGEHHEDIRDLDGLIETWEHLRDVAREGLMNG